MSAERTLVVLKPDAPQRGIAFEILSRFEKRGLRFAALRLLKVDRAMAEKHYAVHKGKFFYNDLVGVITASPVVAAVIEGPNAIAVVPELHAGRVEGGRLGDASRVHAARHARQVDAGAERGHGERGGTHRR